MERGEENEGEMDYGEANNLSVLFVELWKDNNQLLEVSPDILREYLIYLQEDMIKFITASVSARNIHTMIEFLVIILTDVHKDIIQQHKLFDLLARVRSLSREVSLIIHGLEEKPRNEENVDATLDLLENAEHLKGDLRHIFLKPHEESSRIRFPLSDGPLFMHLLLINLGDLLNSNDFSVTFIKEEIRMVKEDLELIRSFFGKVEQELYNDIWIRVLDVAYEAELSINSILVRSDRRLLQLIFLLPNAIEKIKLIKEGVFNLPEKSLNVVKSSNKQVVSNPSSIVGKVIVGFEEETDWIIRKLTSGPAEIDVVSIIGMPGAGKATLASRVYNDKFVASHFDVRAWCTVDQESNTKKFWQNIFNQVTGLKETSGEGAIDKGIADKLRKELLARRYLIVLDDVWDTATWDELTRPFPEFKKKSRIILTSRKKEVALQGKPYSDPLYLRLFRVEESWGLLQRRVFGEENCPTELLNVGKEIAQNCRGLPLVADLIAGVIARKEKSKTSWVDVLNNLNSFVMNNEVDVMKVIQLSYDDLADHLKPCLLYLASYPKDQRIEVMSLKESWYAEGFVEQTAIQNVEKVVDGLLSSSLVTGFHSLGEMEFCQIHDLVHDFCLTKASEENLFSILSTSTQASDLCMPRRILVCYDPLSSSEKKIAYGKHLISVKFQYLHDWQISELNHLRLLRVLRLRSTSLTELLLNEIGHLIHLRYLDVWTNEMKAIPLSWSNLCNLETLVVDNWETNIVLLPRIWDLVKLRRVSMRNCSLLDAVLLANDSKLENLRILDRPTLYSSDDNEDIFKRFPHLQSLKCRISESLEKPGWFPKLDFLNELVEIDASSYSIYEEGFDGDCLSDLHFPRSLKKLRLYGFYLTSNALSTVSGLPFLQQLFLDHVTILEDKWKVEEDDTFKSLISLKLIWMCHFLEWLVGEESFPVLEEIYLDQCDDLKEIPSSFADFVSLKSTHVSGSPQLEDSVLKIKKCIAEMSGEDKLDVLIRP